LDSDAAQAVLKRNQKLSYVGDVTPEQRRNYIAKLTNAIANYGT